MSHITHYRISQLVLELWQRPATAETVMYRAWLAEIIEWMKEKEA